MSVVTTSRRRPPRRVPLPAVLVLAAVLLAVLALCLLREGRASSRPQVGRALRASRSEGPASSGPQEGPSPVPDAPAPSREGPASSGPQEEVSSVAPAPVADPSTLEPINLSTNSAEAPSPDRRPGARLRHGSEQLLAMIISTDETGVPPLPLSPEDEETLRRDLLAAITNDIVIYDDEDARTQEVKERVADAKRQLADILKAGGSVVEAIREYEAHVNEGARLRAEVLAKVAPEVDAITNDAEAVEYVESVNEALKKEDIPPIKLEEVGFEVEEPQGP